MPHIQPQSLAPAMEADRTAQLPPWAQPGESGGDIPIAVYWQYIWRYRWLILTFTLAVTAATTLIALATPKQYQSTAILRIDPSSRGSDTGPSPDGKSDVPLSAQRLLATEAAVVVSPAVVLRTIQSSNLAATHEFAPVSGPSSAAGALSVAELDQVLQKVTGRITVNQPRDTYLLQVSFTSVNPDRAAAAANSLLESLIQQDTETRMQALLGSSQSMQAQLSDLRARMERAETALVQYESRNDVLDPDSKTNIMQARLAQANQDLGAAESQRIALQAEDRIAGSGSLAALMSLDTSGFLLKLDQKQLEDQRLLSQMAQVYGPNYPLYREQAELVKNDAATLQAQAQSIASQIHARYVTALAREDMLRSAFQGQKSNMDSFNLKAVRYYELKAQADSYSKLYYQLQQSIQQSDLAANLHSESLRVISPARVQQTPVAPRPVRDGIIGFLLAVCIAVGAALAKGALDRSISSPEQVELWFSLPALATLPLVASPGRELAEIGGGPRLLGVAAGENGAEARRRAGGSDAFREGVLGLHSALLLSKGQDLRTFAITSSVPGEGKSTITANLAVAFANLGKRTIVVDADMRKPSAHRLFGLSNVRGLSAVLRGHTALDAAIQPVPAVPNLSVLTAGTIPANPTELLHLGLSDLLEKLTLNYDHILLDCPPVLGFADTATAANLTEGCALVVHAGQTDRQMVAASLRQLRAAQARVVGIVLNKISERLSSYYSYYSHYGHYGSAEAGEADSAED